MHLKEISEIHLFRSYNAVKRDRLQWVFFLSVCVGRAFLTAAINFACVFYYNHVSLLGSDSCVAAGFTVIPLETAQCEEKHKKQTAFPNVLCRVHLAVHDATDLRCAVHTESIF